LQALFEDRAERLTEHPFMYRTGRVPGTREAVVHPNFIMVYRVDANSVEIVNIIHSRRRYPPADDD
jgi:plasmid stabilization system protein ParE